MKVNSVGLLKSDPDGCDNFPHHEPDRGGNREFETSSGQGVLTNITSLFQVEAKTKYQVDESSDVTGDTATTSEDI